jgi:hypothetical protein
MKLYYSGAMSQQEVGNAMKIVSGLPMVCSRGVYLHAVSCDICLRSEPQSLSIRKHLPLAVTAAYIVPF